MSNIENSNVYMQYIHIKDEIIIDDKIDAIFKQNQSMFQSVKLH